MESRLSIGEVAERAGLAPSALRYYEAEGLLPEPARVSGRRVYDDGVLRRVDVVRACQAAGFTIREIRALFGAFDDAPATGDEWHAVAEAKVAEVAALEVRAAALRRWLEGALATGRLRVEDWPFEQDVPEEPGRLAREMSPRQGAVSTARKRRTRSLG